MLVAMRPTEVVVWPRGELVRYLREDMATDLLMEAWVTISWGLRGHPHATPTLGGGGLGGTMTKWSEVAHMAAQPSKSM